MPQPSGQVLLDSAKPNHAATSFWYAQGSGLWDAKGGAMLAKTGPAGVAAEGGANVLLGDGATYYALASSLTLSGPFTLIVRARTTTAGSTASMVCGSRLDNNNFVWLASSGSQLTLRANGNSRALANTASNVMATYAFVRDAGGILYLYKNGTFVASGPQASSLLITHILSGYTSTSFIHNGALEFLHIINGVALDATAVSSYNADPYQDLVAAAPPLSVSAAGTAAMSWAASGAVDASGVPPLSASVAGSGAMSWAAVGAASASIISESIALTNPADYQTRQRNLVSNTAGMAVSGTYTGSPASIQYRFAGGTWATLIASPSGGTFSTSVTLPTGQGTFEVRFSNATSVTDSAAYVTVGDVFIVAGQSNHAGRSTVKVDPVFTNFVVPKLGRDFVWKPLTEATTPSGSFDEAASAAGSYIGALSTRLQSVGVPIAFCPVAQGSTSINDWERYDADPTNPYLLYGDARQADIAAGGNRAMLYLQGESDAQNGMEQATYEGKLNGIVTDWQADTGGKVFIIQIVRWTSGIYGQIDAIRAAQAAVAAINPAVAGIADGNVASWQAANNVHYNTTTQINDLADVVSAGMVTAFYSNPTSAVAGAATMTWAAQAGVSVTLVDPAAVQAAVAASAAMAWAATGAASANILPPVAADAQGAATMVWAATGGVSATVLPPPVDALVQGLATMVWSATGRVIVSDGSIVWPATRAGEANTARVPFDGVRVIVPDADDAASPVKVIPLYVGDTERILVDWEAKYLPGAGDTAATVLALDAPVGVAVTPSVAPGAALTTGVVVLAVTPTGAAGTYRVALRIGTAGGRESTALVDVVVSATVQSAKTFRLRSTADRDVFDMDFAAKYLAGAADVADVLLTTSADAGLTADARLDVGGVVQVAVDNPDAPGTYQVRTQLQTAAGRRKTGAIDVEVLA